MTTYIDLENITSPGSPIHSEAESAATSNRRWSKVKRILYEFQFCIQALLSIGIVLWCLIALSANFLPATERTILYTLMSGILGYWLPAPKLKQDNSSQPAPKNVNVK